MYLVEKQGTAADKFDKQWAKLSMQRNMSFEKICLGAAINRYINCAVPQLQWSLLVDTLKSLRVVTLWKDLMALGGSLKLDCVVELSEATYTTI